MIIFIHASSRSIPDDVPARRRARVKGDVCARYCASKGMAVKGYMEHKQCNTIRGGCTEIACCEPGRLQPASNTGKINAAGEADSLRAENTELKSKLEDCTQNLAALTEKAKEADKLKAQLEEEKRARKEEDARWKNEVEDLKAKLEALEQAKVNAEKEAANLRVENTELKSKLEDLTQSLAAETAKAEEARKAKAAVESQLEEEKRARKEESARCKNEVDDLKAKVQSLEQAAAGKVNADKEAERLRAEITELKSKLADLTQSLAAETAKAEESRKSKVAAEAQLEEEKRARSEESARCKKEVEDLKAKIQSLEQAAEGKVNADKEAERLRAEIAELKTKLEDLTKSLAEAEKSKAAVEAQLEEEKKARNEESARCKNEVADLKAKIQSLEQAANTNANTNEEAERLRAENAKLKSKVEDLTQKLEEEKRARNEEAARCKKEVEDLKAKVQSLEQAAPVEENAEACNDMTPLKSGDCCDKTTKKIKRGKQMMSWRWCDKPKPTPKPTPKPGPGPKPTKEKLNGEEYCEGSDMLRNEESCKASSCCHWNDSEQGDASFNGQGRCWSSISTSTCNDIHDSNQHGSQKSTTGTCCLCEDGSYSYSLSGTCSRCNGRTKYTRETSPECKDSSKSDIPACLETCGQILGQKSTTGTCCLCEDGSYSYSLSGTCSRCNGRTKYTKETSPECKDSSKSDIPACLETCGQILGVRGGKSYRDHAESSVSEQFEEEKVAEPNKKAGVAETVERNNNFASSQMEEDKIAAEIAIAPNDEAGIINSNMKNKAFLLFVIFSLLAWIFCLRTPQTRDHDLYKTLGEEDI